MRVLLDTPVVLWWASSGGAHLSPVARDVIAAEDTEAVVSAVSALEISAKATRGRLELPDVADRYVPRLIEQHGFVALSVHLSHALRAGSLPDLHRDPWDRLLVAQAQVEGIPIITADPAIGRYDVETIW